MIRYIVLVLFGCLAIHSSESLACSCAPLPSPTEAVGGADAVFLATVRSSEPVDGNSPLGKMRFHFTVEKAWKGVASSELQVTTSKSGSLCGFQFEINQSYLVYASDAGDRGLSTNICTRTRHESQAKADLDEIGQPNFP